MNVAEGIQMHGSYMTNSCQYNTPLSSEVLVPASDTKCNYICATIIKAECDDLTFCITLSLQ